VGWAWPDIPLKATIGEPVNLLRLPGRSVVFLYPYTGRPGIPDPDNWNSIPGAHGSTPQAQAYSVLYDEFRNRNINVFGISLQDTDWQAEFAARCVIRVPLLSDHKQALKNALGLPVFHAGTGTYLDRLTLLLNNGRISHVRYPVPRPESDAHEVLALFDRPAA